MYEIDADVVDTYSGYDGTVTSSDGGEITIKDCNTYYIDSYTGTYYIGVDVSEVPGDVTVEITDVEFYE